MQEIKRKDGEGNIIYIYMAGKRLIPLLYQSVRCL